MQHQIEEAAAGAPTTGGVDGDENIAVRRNGGRIICLRQEPLRDELWSGESQRAGVKDGAVVPKTAPHLYQIAAHSGGSECRLVRHRQGADCPIACGPGQADESGSHPGSIILRGQGVKADHSI